MHGSFSSLIRRHVGSVAFPRFRGTGLGLSSNYVSGAIAAPEVCYLFLASRKETGGKMTSSPQTGHFRQAEPWLPR